MDYFLYQISALRNWFISWFWPEPILQKLGHLANTQIPREPEVVSGNKSQNYPNKLDKDALLLQLKKKNTSLRKQLRFTNLEQRKLETKLAWTQLYSKKADQTLKIELTLQKTSFIKQIE